MKIEKITENKIRIIVKSEDLGAQNQDLHSIMTKSIENQSLFLNILARAEKEVGFNTDGHKLLIEAFSSGEDTFVFTITKYKAPEQEKEIAPNNHAQKKLTVKRKNLSLSSRDLIYKFNDFEEFCNLCNYINTLNNLNIDNICSNISLYLYNKIYYLCLSNINYSNLSSQKFNIVLSEFASPCLHSKVFKFKLFEHGIPIIKKDAISIGIKHFVK
jgi:negative regulator of genetic competence, sporulation and motility